MRVRSVLSLVLVSWIVCSSAQPVDGRQKRATTLSEPKPAFRIVAEDFVEVRWGKLAARLVNNQAVPPDHAAGYNGLLDLRYEGSSSPFVARFAGLNLEHVNNGIA